MEISVTVPVYNVEKYLKRCLDSIINQTFRLEYDIICVDDGSTDNSGRILDEYAAKYPKIKVIHQKQQGLSGARNTAVKHACGKYIMFVDSDDFIAQNTLESLYNYAQKYDCDVVVFDFLRATADMKNISRQHFQNIASKYRDTSFNADTAEPFVYRFFPVATWVKFYRTDLIKDIEFADNLNNQDVVHWAQVYTKAKKINYLPIPFYVYTIQRQDAITQIKGKKAFDVFRAFSLAEEVLRNTGYFEKFKYIHYAHFTCNLVMSLQKIIPELHKEFVEEIQKLKMDIDYDAFYKEDFFQFEKDNMNIIKFIKDNDYEKVELFLKQKNIWR